MPTLASERLRRHITVMFTELADHLRVNEPPSALHAAAEVALKRIGGADSASVTLWNTTGFSTATHTDGVALGADRIQYDLGQGPALTVIESGEPAYLGDPRHRHHWPELEARLADRYSVLSALCVPLGTARNETGDISAGLNLYGTTVDAFGPMGVRMTSVLAAYAGYAWRSMASAVIDGAHEHEARDLAAWGPAIGLLMARHALNCDDAITMLRTTSRATNRPIADLAAEVVQCGDLGRPAKPFILARREAG